MRQWFSSQASAKQRGIQEVIEQGVATGETIDQMVRRIRKGGDLQRGIIEISRNHAESVVRTAVSHTTQGVRDAFYGENSDLIKGVQWLSTLDGRTSPMCMVRDGKQYNLKREPVGHSYPWGGGPGRLHFRCRSTSVPVLKSWRELGFDADDTSAGERASMDGAVPPKTTFDEFLRRKAKRGGGRAFVRDVLGRTRAQRFFNGAKIDRFVDDQGRWKLISALRGSGSGKPPKRPFSPRSVSGLQRKVRDFGKRGGRWLPPTRIRLSDSDLRSLEHDVLRHQPNEVLLVVGPRGRVRAMKGSGKPNQVTLGGVFNTLRGARLTHNHPGSSSFSFADIAVLHSELLEEIRAIGADGTLYRAQILDRSQWVAIEADAHRFGRMVYKHLMDRITNGRISRSEAARRHQHLVWSLVARKYPLAFRYQVDRSRVGP